MERRQGSLCPFFFIRVHPCSSVVPYSLLCGESFFLARQIDDEDLPATSTAPIKQSLESRRVHHQFRQPFCRVVSPEDASPDDARQLRARAGGMVVSADDAR